MAESIAIAISFEMLYSSCVYSVSLVLDEIDAINNPTAMEQTMQSTVPFNTLTLPEPAITTIHHPNIAEMITVSSISISSPFIFDSAITISPVDEVNEFILREAESLVLPEPVVTSTTVNDVPDSVNNDPPPPYSIEDRY